VVNRVAPDVMVQAAIQTSFVGMGLPLVLRSEKELAVDAAHVTRHGHNVDEGLAKELIQSLAIHLLVRAEAKAYPCKLLEPRGHLDRDVSYRDLLRGHDIIIA
jgi:hypothetical protein